MKLNRSQIAAVRRETKLAPVPPAVADESGLAGAFGDQTFYVDPEGVYVFEPVEQPSGEEPLMAIQIAIVEREAPEADEVVLRPVQPRTTSLLVAA